jgi:hypothetical protein
MLVVIGTDCIDSCKSNYHTIMTTTEPSRDWKANNLKVVARKPKALNRIASKLSGVKADMLAWNQDK